MTTNNISNTFCIIGTILFIAKDFSYIVVEVTHKNNNDSENEVDEFPIYLTSAMASNSIEFLKLKDFIGVKGHLKCHKYLKDGVAFRQTKLIADKISFLQSASKDGDD